MRFPKQIHIRIICVLRKDRNSNYGLKSFSITVIYTLQFKIVQAAIAMIKKPLRNLRVLQLLDLAIKSKYLTRMFLPLAQSNFSLEIYRSILLTKEKNMRFSSKSKNCCSTTLKESTHSVKRAPNN